MKIKNAAFGSEERKNKRKERYESVLKKADTLIKKHLPFVYDPILPSSKYEIELPALLNAIENEFSSINDFRDARNHLSKLINKGNENQTWSLNIPPYLIRMRRESPLRSFAWFKRTRELNQWYELWIKTIGLNDTSINLDSSETILINILISSIFHGGLCDKRYVFALANALIHEDLILCEYDGHIWLELIHLEASKKELRQWHPDILSLMLINRFYSVKSARITPYKTEAALWTALLKYMKAMDNFKGKLPESFAFLCRSAIGVTERLNNISLPQALLEYAINRTVSTPIKRQNLQSLIEPVYVDVKPVAYDSFSYASFADWQPLCKCERRTNENTFPVLIKEIRDALNDKQDIAKKNTNKKAIEKLQLSITGNQISFACELLVSWLIYLLKKDLKISTARRYFSAIGPIWMIKTIDVDFSVFSAYDFEDLYLEILEDELNTKQAGYRAGRLKQLHEFGVSEYNFPNLGESLLDEYTQHKSNTRSGFISKALFNHLCGYILSITDLDLETKRGIVLVIIICYRSGLRRGEALKLTLKDVEDSPNFWLFIRNNQYGNNKNNSPRKIPLSALLTETERQQFSSYLAERRFKLKNSPTALLFSMPNTPTVPHDANKLSQLVNYFLRKASSLDLTFHHLRHSAFCNIQVVIENDQALIHFLTPYSLEHARNIRKALVCAADENTHKDAYYSLAALAGHASPEMTFDHYLHFSDWILANHLRKLDIGLSNKQVVTISALPIKSLLHLHKNNTTEVQYETIRHNLIEQLRNKKRVHHFKRTLTQQVDKKEYSQDIIKVQKSTNLCYMALQDYQQGLTIFDLINKYALPEADIRHWIDSSKALSQLKTTRGDLRLISKIRKASHQSAHLLPAKPNSREENQQVDKAINAARILVRKDKEKLKWCLVYFLENINTSSSGLVFRNQEDLITFITNLQGMFKKADWRLHFNPLENNNETYPIELKQIFSQCSIKVNKPYVKNKNIYPDGKMVLFLKHPNELSLIEKSIEAQNKQRSKYSSSSLRYLFHMLSIMMLSKDEIEVLPCFTPPLANL
jgi:integrase